MPLPERRHARSAALATAALLILLAGCSGDPSDEASGVPDQTPTATTQPTDPTPTPAPTTPAAEQVIPEQQLHAGAVAPGQGTTLSGTGPAVVGFTRSGEFAIVVGVDCTACTGSVVITQEGRGTPWGAGDAPLTGSYLVDIFKDTSPEQSIIVQAEGPWTVDLQSWNDLEFVQGPQQGTGSTVLRIGDNASGMEVTYAPAGSGDRFSARAFSAVDIDPSGNPVSVLFGNDAAFTESHELAFPGVVAITTNGTWSLTPLP